ncbi:MAG: 50S ribosomal protein L13 [Armatimonadota bacterium]|nr:50S ribosomal protein L13 [Armatimonadota bacterium]MDR5704005.1 50S ribosomal protein L13 [Armatimonadota bacterium]MDR7433911.1 50S ribosomal protein L13 [Armatimonadota bacterium]
MKTIMAKPNEVEERWYLVDASGKVLGRLASRIAAILRGKHRPIFTPHVDLRDFVIVINAEKIRLTGRKAQQKMLYRHSGYPGGLKEVSYGTLLATNPEQLIRKAVMGMLPKNPLGRKLLKKLKVYRGPDHPHQAQRPVPLDL